MARLAFHAGMGLVRDNPETFENAVASLVDFTSILFAYQIGVYGFGIAFGMLYACFDAFIVIWMRKPISRFARSINPFRFRAKAPDAVSGQGQTDASVVGPPSPAPGQPAETEPAL
ncbi:MAG: hypothetical protein JRM85_07450 [Nitrososphaerota archaeon]|jgi:hypothetical protein|nr:hypothetical protein [Nitrososphaerota archaeon]MDG6917410.1 hypothetical protein [Nitrososphaerota archaeon]MDG6919456.1 hypothetical protein [Nitrososphaerota archaeon]